MVGGLKARLFAGFLHHRQPMFFHLLPLKNKEDFKPPGEVITKTEPIETTDLVDQSNCESVAGIILSGLRLSLAHLGQIASCNLVQCI